MQLSGLISGEMLLIGTLLALTIFQVFGTDVALQRNHYTRVSMGDFECHNNYKLSLSAPEFHAGQTTKVDSPLDCGFACVRLERCFSYNFGITADGNGKHICELLSTDKYNNSDKLQADADFHHFSIRSPCSISPCLRGGQCVALYYENDFKCACTAQFTGRICDTYVYHEVFVRAAGYDDPRDRFPSGEEGKSSIKVNGMERAQQLIGHNLVVVNMDGTVESSVSYNTHSYVHAGSQISSFINSIPTGRIVLVATMDTASKYYSGGSAALQSIGAQNSSVKYREGWYLIGYKGGSKPWIREGRVSRYNGPVTITVQIPTSA